MSAGFQCKKFYVAHDRCAMKVGTDGLLLGAFAPLPPVGCAILDIGAGSGLISLMLAQRTAGASPIDAVELDAAAAEQAALNVANSPWPEAIRLIKGDILTYHTDKRYRLIVSNPPFFQRALAAQDARRHQARHTDSLPFTSLLSVAAGLLCEEGTLAIVLPVSSAEDFISLALSGGWQLQHSCTVFTKPAKAHRSLLCFGRGGSAGKPQHTQLYIHDESGAYSLQYQQLLSAFYLKFPD
ncbi:MAG: tRNA1Val (adenine37-N6)-methyltransferase [Rheinheimera aquimaris]|jgi:tRNA1Val (adenine37-N6)-methyltransferase|nr:methyltransferase [Rheinheimera sp.]